jgi:N-acetylmuramoyl-L-alanine amidase
MTVSAIKRVLCCFLICKAVFAGQIQSMVIEKFNNDTRIHFSLSGSFTYKAFTLNNPYRVVVDFYSTNKSVQSLNTPKHHDLIKNIRYGRPKPSVYRVVIDLKYKAKLKTHKKGNQVLVDLTSTKKTPSVSKTMPQAFPKQHNVKTPILVSQSPSKSLRDVVIIIDAGHGGKDPGAIGPTRHREKTVVLAIALKLKAIIDKAPGMRAVLTRKGDYYVGLRQRLDIARKYDGDIFVSIHADAYKNRKSNGVSVFALSQTGATSEAARWLAEKENYSELGGVNLSELDDQNGIIRSVLIDLSQTATIGASLKVGERVLRSMDDLTRLHHKDVEQARFVVLKSPDIPSILVETGFISNPREEKNLASSWYQTKLSKAIYTGIKQYFFDHPPHGSYIEAMVNTKHHTVKRGETLSGIAVRYRTSIGKLKSLNHLKNDQVRVGQRLSVPKKWS